MFLEDYCVLSCEPSFINILILFNIPYFMFGALSCKYYW